ncbi:lipase esterase [Phlyctema vagabunda]|uniref:Lipase esterase n=1 Tax=Phlyctema vagabunda TaxID=108571 RepID=A0ABR4PJH1_9HELO
MYRMHGGGWVVGRHEVDGAENVYAAVNRGIIVASVDYRKAPEHPFPQALDDSYDGLLWCKRNAKLLGINPEKIVLSGSSAGANLAAALALEARDNSISGIRAQVLHFPSVCHPKFFPSDQYEFGSYVQNYSNCVLGTLRMETFLDAYMPNPHPDHRFSPLLAESLTDLPPTLIQCAGADILRDDAYAFAEALKAEDVEVEIHCYPGLPHCFPAILTTASETSQFYERYCEFLEMYKCGPGEKITI